MTKYGLRYVMLLPLTGELSFSTRCLINGVLWGNCLHCGPSVSEIFPEKLFYLVKHFNNLTLSKYNKLKS